jgi:hypothetical protein
MSSEKTGGMEGKIIQLNVEFKQHRVRLEPELEAEAGDLSPDARDQMARLYYRWAKQLWASAQALRARPLRRPARQRAHDARIQH